MKLARAMTVLAWWLASACGGAGDDATPAGSGGATGAAGSGAAGAAGSGAAGSGAAGTAGTAGSAGAAGTAGTASSGTAGSGAAGTAGAAGAGTAGAAGAGTAGAAGAGTGGTGTAGAAGAGTGGVGGGAAGAPACITDVSAKPRHVFTCSGLTWNVSVPQQCVTTDCGLVFDVHGRTMSGEMEDANTGLAALGAKHGYIVVQPNADPAPPLSAWVAAEDDGRVFDFLKRAIDAFHVDPRRVHFTGFSQGGDMTWRFACEHADVIASAAPGAYGQSVDEKCFSKGKAPARPIPLLYMHGTKDVLGGLFATAEAARDAVIKVYGLSKDATLSSDADHIWTRYTSPSGAVLEFIQHDYTGGAVLQGHCYPGSTDPSGAPGQLFSFKCEQAAAFTWGEAVMQFFVAHPMP